MPSAPCHELGGTYNAGLCENGFVKRFVMYKRKTHKGMKKRVKLSARGKPRYKKSFLRPLDERQVGRSLSSTSSDLQLDRWNRKAGAYCSLCRIGLPSRAE